MNIREYTETDKEQIIQLIVSIQNDEFGIKITPDDQPDLKIIPAVYQKGRGSFWVATDSQKVVGTIALIDIGDNKTALRKMFVHSAYRGKEIGVAQKLLNVLLNWCRSKGIETVYLGTIDVMKAAHRFYERNGFQQISKEQLPGSFPVMPVDNVFYKFSFINNA